MHYDHIPGALRHIVGNCSQESCSHEARIPPIIDQRTFFIWTCLEAFVLEICSSSEMNCSLSHLFDLIKKKKPPLTKQMMSQIYVLNYIVLRIWKKLTLFLIACNACAFPQAHLANCFVKRHLNKHDFKYSMLCSKAQNYIFGSLKTQWLLLKEWLGSIYLCK